MTFPILVESHEGQFVASLVGTSNVRVVEPTRSQAISSLKIKIRQSLESGELFLLELDSVGLSNLAGKYESDPTLRDICEEAYQIREEEAPQ